jgi:hypothetical protein
MRHSAGTRQSLNLLPDGTDVVGQPVGFQRVIETSYQPLVLGRNAYGAVACVASLRLDTADRHHRFARDCDHVAAKSERENSGFGEAKLPGSDKHDVFVHARFGKLLVHAAESLA